VHFFRRGQAIWPALVVFTALAQADGDIERAVALEQAGKADQAIALLQGALKRDPRSAEAHNWLGVAYLQKNKLTEAEAEFRQAIKLKPDFVRAYNNLGSTLAQAGDILEGIKALEQGLRYAPKDLQLNVNVGMALRSKGDADAALSHFQPLLAEHPDSPELQYQYGQTLRQKGDLAGATAAFERALELNPEAQEVYYGLGQALKESAGRVKKSRTPPEELKTGSQALAHGDFGQAREAAEKAIARDPQSAEAYNLLGYALWYSGDREKAGAALDKALALDPAAGDIYGFRGMMYRDAGALGDARRMLERAIALNPQAPLAYFDLAVVFLRTGDLDHAIGQFEAGLNLPGASRRLPEMEVPIRELRGALATKPDSAGGQVVLGRLLGLAGADSAQVIAALREAIRLRSDDAAAHNSLGLVYVQTGDDENAIAEFRAAIKLRPDFADAHQNLGAVLTTSDVDEAVRELETAVKLDPRMLKAQYNLALAYETNPKHGPVKAVEQLQKLMAADARYPRAEYAIGRALLRERKVDEAVGHLRKAVEQEPDFGEARYQLGLALSRAGKAEDGAAEIRRSREIIAAGEEQQNLSLDLADAKSALERGDTDAAIAKARKVLHFRADAVEASNVLELALERYIRAGRFQEVEAVLEPHLSEHPNSAREWYMLGYSQYGLRKIGDSVKSLAKSLELDKTNADAHKVLGRDLMIIGRFDAARLEFEQAARLNPKSPEMPYNLGKLYSIQDNWADAKREFETAIRLDPNYMEAHDGLGFAREALGDDAGAVESYKRAIEMNEARRAGFVSPYVNMSALSNRTGDHSAALDYARKALAINPRSDRALFQLAKAQEYEGDIAGAADSLNRAISINPRVSSYFYVLATAYRKLNKAEESRAAMESFSKLERESNELEQKRREFLKEK